MSVNFADFIIAKESETERAKQYENLAKLARQWDIDYEELDLPDEIHKHRLRTNGKPHVAFFNASEQAEILQLLRSVFDVADDDAHKKMMEIANKFKEKIDPSSSINNIEARQTVVQADSQAEIRHVYALSSVENTPAKLADGAPGYSRTHNDLLYTETKPRQRQELSGVPWHIDDFTDADRIKFHNAKQGGNFVSVFSDATNAMGSLYLPGEHIPVHPRLSRALQNVFLRNKDKILKQRYVTKLEEDMRRYNPRQAQIGQILCTSNTLHRAPYSNSLHEGNVRYMVRVTLNNTNKVTMYDMNAKSMMFNFKIRFRV